MILPGTPIETNRHVAALGLDAYPSSTSAVLGATAEEAFATNPTPALGQILRTGSPTLEMSSEFGSVPITPAPTSDLLSPEDATARYGIPGQLTFTQPVAEATASDFNQAKRDELARQDVFRRAQGGFVEGAGKLGVGLIASLLDPLNVASAFIPIVPEARYALWAEKMGPTAARLAKGAAEGAVGAAAVEPLVYGAATQRQADYSATDSLLNIAFGTALGGGLHAGLGALGDAIARQHLDEPALRGAVAAVVEDRPVEVGAPILKAVREPDISIARAEPAARSDVGGRPPVEGTDAARAQGSAPALGAAADLRATTSNEDVALGQRTRSAILSAASYAEDPETFADLVTQLKVGPKLEGQRLLAFLEKKGGIQDQGGELSVLDLNAKTAAADMKAVGATRKGLVRPDGMPLDTAREVASQAGYLPNDSTIADFLDLVRQDFVAGTDVARGVHIDQDAAAKIEHHTQLQDMASELSTLGVDLHHLPATKAARDEARAEIGRLAEAVRSDDASLNAELDRMFNAPPDQSATGAAADLRANQTNAAEIADRAVPADPAAQLTAIEQDIADIEAQLKAHGLELDATTDEMAKLAEARAKGAEAAASCELLRAPF